MRSTRLRNSSSDWMGASCPSSQSITAPCTIDHAASSGVSERGKPGVARRHVTVGGFEKEHVCAL